MNLRTYLNLSVLFIFSFSFGVNLSAQEIPFNPFPKNDTSLYHLDFKKFFTDEQTEKEDLTDFYSSLERFSSYKGKSTSSAKNLFQILSLYDSLQIKYFRHYAYHNLLFSVNKENIRSRDLSEEITSAFITKTIFLNKEIASLTPEMVNKFTVLEPQLKKYNYYLQTILRDKPHQPDNSLQEKLSELDPLLTGWQFDLYNEITSHVNFPDIEVLNGAVKEKLNSRRDKNSIMINRDSSARESSFKLLFSGYNSSRDLYAFTLVKLCNAADKNAQLHNFNDAAEYYYFDKYYTKPGIENVFRQIVDSVRIYKDYQRIRKDYKSKQLITNEVHLWDLQYSPNLFVPRYTIDSAKSIILNSLKYLGPEVQNEMYKLFDPGNGRLEVAPGKNKRSGGFSRGFTEVNSIFYTEGFRGYYNDVRLMTHESTHALHRQMMNQNNVIPDYATGPNYLFESFAIFSEFLLSDYFIEHAATNEARIYFYEQFFDNKGMTLFTAGSDAILEQNIHEGVKNGSINTADDLDKANDSINNIFSIWSTKQYLQLNQRWITNSLYYEDPFYNVNYVLAAILALKYYDIYRKDPENFRKNYCELMKNGFDDNPDALLKKFLGVDIESPDLLNGAFESVRIKINELELLYKEK